MSFLNLSKIRKKELQDVDSLVLQLFGQLVSLLKNTKNLKLVSLTKKCQKQIKHPWKMWLDTSLFLLAIVAIMNAIFGFSGTQTSYGLTTLLSVSFIGGLAMYTPYHYIYRHNNKPKEERPKWWFSMTVITLSFIAWFALFSLTALLPSYLNPGLSPIVILIIGVIAGVAKYFFKRHYNVQSTYATCILINLKHP